MKNNYFSGAARVAVTVAIDVLKFPRLLKLLNQVFVKRNPEFGRQLDFIRLDHLDLDRGCPYLGCRVLLGDSNHFFLVEWRARGGGTLIWFSGRSGGGALCHKLFLY